MKPLIRALCMITALGLALVAITVPALASARPSVTSLSAHRGTYWGSSLITVRGHNFTHVKKVLFGTKKGQSVHVVSSTKLTVRDPVHSYGTVHVWVVTSAGTSSKSSANAFTFTRPTMNSKIQGGLTGRQEQRISAAVRRAHKGVATSRRSSTWTAAMGVTAVRRARSWLGLPYSWAAGNSRGPTLGVCAHNGGDMDCHIVGFDCSGLALYAWAPYKALVHYAATQHSRAGRFHPTIGQLMPGDLVFFSGVHEKVIGHVAIYEGGGLVVQAPQSGSRVMVSRLVDVIANSGRYRGATRPLSTGRQGPVPRLSAMTSQVSIKGGYLTITGTQLGSATSVAVGGKLVYSFAKRTASSLVVKVPAHVAGRATVTVSNAWGSANRVVTYVAAPQLTGLTPAQGLTTGGTTVTLTGKNFTGVTKVAVGTAAAKFVVASSTKLTVTTPAHAAGAVTVTVYTRFGTSNRKVYTFVAAPSPTTSGTPATSPTGSTAAPTTSPPTDPTTSASSTPADPTTGAPSPPADPTTSTAPAADPSTSAPVAAP